MSTEDRSQLSPEDRESLTAYLDGELSENASSEMERTIAIDTEVQHEADMLKRTWDLLDELPRPRLSQNFTTRTLATIQLSELEATQKTPPLQMVKISLVVLVWLVAFMSSAVVGYMVSNRWEKPPHAEMIRNLDLIDQLDTYPYIGQEEFLRELQKSNKFDEPPLQPQSP